MRKQLVAGAGGIAVVGSRNASEDDLDFARNLGADAAERGYSVVSGGARGVDRHAMQGALEREGTALGVLADSLLRSAMAAGYRQYILSGDLALVSPFNPEARFNVGNAMARNACIYCLAEAAVVVSSDAGKGGTWSGAVEDLEHRWVPLWVKPDSAPGSGNPELVRRGAAWLPAEAGQLWRPMDGVLPADPLFREAPEHGTLAEAAPPPFGEPSQPADGGLYALFLARIAELTTEKPASIRRIVECLQLQEPQVKDWLQRAVDEGRVERGPRGARCETPRCAPRSPADDDFYAHFMDRAARIASVVAMPVGDIAEQLQLREHQAADWLKRAVDEGRMVRQESPVRYRTAEASLFGDRA